MDPVSSEIAAFITPSGLYKPLVMPFGLKNAPATFQAAMNRALGDILGRFAVVYIDDILIYSNSFEEHCEHVRLVLAALGRACLRVRDDKCTWFAKELDFLGHHVSAAGVSAMKDKVEDIEKAVAPSNVKELRSFLGLANYYRRFVRNFSIIAAPLNLLLRAGEIFRWTDAQQEAFSELKHALTKTVVVPYPIYDGRPFIIETDASNVGMGAVISQNFDGVERPIAYWSAGYDTVRQSNYSATDREFLAILRAVCRFEYMLDGSPIIVRTDHQPLHDIFKAADLPIGHRGRWIAKLSPFNLKITYKPGALNQAADACSRHPIVPPSHVPAAAPSSTTRPVAPETTVRNVVSAPAAVQVPKRGRPKKSSAPPPPPPHVNNSTFLPTSSLDDDASTVDSITSSRAPSGSLPSSAATETPDGSTLSSPPASVQGALQPLSHHFSAPPTPLPPLTAKFDSRDVRLVVGDANHTFAGWQSLDPLRRQAARSLPQPNKCYFQV